MVRKTHGCVCYHLMNVEGTGCVIDGPHHILFNGEEPDFEPIHRTPAPLISLTNSSWKHKEANCCKVVDHEMVQECTDNMKLDTTVWLETTRDIEVGEELVWDYMVHHRGFE